MALPLLYGNGSPAYPTPTAWAGSFSGGDPAVLNDHSTGNYHDSGGARCGSAGGHSGNDDDPFDNAWYKFVFPDFINIDKIQLQYRSSQYIDPTAIFVSSDDVTYTKVLDQGGGAGGVETFAFTQEDSVKYVTISDQADSGFLTVRTYWVDFYAELGSAPASSGGSWNGGLFIPGQPLITG